MQEVFVAAKTVMEIPITLFGFTFSFWNVMLWSLVGGLLIWFVGKVFNDD